MKKANFKILPRLVFCSKREENSTNRYAVWKGIVTIFALLFQIGVLLSKYISVLKLKIEWRIILQSIVHVRK